MRRTPVLTASFLNFLGLNLALPILTPLFLHPGAGLLPFQTPLWARTMALGGVLGLFPLVQFFSAPLLGAWGDKWGRRPVLLLSAAGMGLGYVGMALGVQFQSLGLLIGARFFQGVMSGGVAVTQAAMSDISTPQTRPGNFGLLGATFGLSLFLGPALGGFFSDNSLVVWFNYALPFWLAAGASALNLGQIAWFFRESLPLEHRKTGRIHLMTGPRNLVKAFSDSRLALLFLAAFLYSFGFNFYSQFLQTWVTFRYQVTQTQVGILYSIIGVGSLLTQGVLVGKITARWNSYKVLNWTFLTLSATFLVLWSLPNFWVYAGLSLLVPLSNGLTNPNMIHVTSSQADRNSQGSILGLNQSVVAAGQFLSPFIGGILVGWEPSFALWGTSLILLGAWVFFRRFSQKGPPLETPV